MRDFGYFRWCRPHWIDQILNDLKELKTIMSQVTDTLTAVTAALNGISTDIDTMTADITALQASIGTGTLSADDQAALASIVSAATALQAKTDAAVAAIPTPTPTSTSSSKKN